MSFNFKGWFIAILLLVSFIITLFIYYYSIAPLRHTNVILITIDTLRADHVGFYGYKENTTPFIDKVARESVVFSNVYTQIPLTLPSHTAILTSTFPKTNGVRLNGFCHVDDRLTTLAEILKAHNYSTYAVIGGFPLDSRFGLSQGFDVYDDKIEKDSKSEAKTWHHHKYLRYERRANEVTDRGYEILKKINRRDKFFLWLHYFDPHWRYRPPKEFKERFELAYDGEIAFVDSEIKRFFEILTEKKVLKNSLIIITSDHGEGLQEHGEEGHGWELFNTTLRVPLLFYYPAVLPIDKRLDILSQSIDILPTALELLNIESPAGIEGRSLCNYIWEREAATDRKIIYAESNKPRIMYNNNTRYALVSDCYKLITYYDTDDQIVEYQLFNIKADPNELHNIASLHPEIVKELVSEIDEFFIPASTRFALFKANEEVVKKLKALGYID